MRKTIHALLIIFVILSTIQTFGLSLTIGNNTNNSTLTNVTTQNPSCSSGIKCYNNITTGYQSSTCAWSNLNTCSSGTICRNGACVQVAVNTIASTCTDSDGGKNYYVKGTAFGKTDSCWTDEKTLTEYSCNNNGTYAGDTNYICPNGCKDGACVKVTVNTTASTCVDTDGGLNYYINGKTSGYDKPSGRYVTVMDYCQYDSLKEYTCDGIYGKENEYVCPNGCKEGVCVKEDVIKCEVLNETECAKRDNACYQIRKTVKVGESCTRRLFRTKCVPIYRNKFQSCGTREIQTTINQAITINKTSPICIDNGACTQLIPVNLTNSTQKLYLLSTSNSLQIDNKIITIVDNDGFNVKFRISEINCTTLTKDECYKQQEWCYFKPANTWFGSVISKEQCVKK